MQHHVTKFLHCITETKIRSCVALAWWLVYIYAVTVYASHPAHEILPYNNKYYIYKNCKQYSSLELNDAQFRI